MDEKVPNPENPRDPSFDEDVDELTSELVAYLDGELDPEGNEVVEARIGVDTTVRAEADALKKTWDLLDYLPRSEPSPSFTERTISRIEPLTKSGTNGPASGSVSAKSGSTANPSGVASAKTGPTTNPSRLSTSSPPIPPLQRSRGRKLLVGVSFLIALVGVGVGGYFTRAQVNERLHRFDQQEQDAKILSERPLLQNLRHYRHVDDIEFLKALDNPELFGEEHPAPVNEASK